MRLAVILSHPTQYYSPWFRWISRHTGVTLRVFYLWDFGVRAQRDPRFETTFAWDVDLLSGYEHEFVPNCSRTPGTETFLGLRNPDLPTRLNAFGPDALLLFGYKSRSHLRAIAWARTRGIPLLFRGDSHFLGRGAQSGPRRWMLRMLYAQFGAFLNVGAANRDYFRLLGVPDRKLFFAPHSVNHELFNPASEPHRQAARALRAQLGIPSEAIVLLFAGKFVPAKNPIALLEAFVAVGRSDSALVFVGDGAQKNDLQSLANRTSGGNVHFLPFANQSEMPARYLMADVFALPSTSCYETWGLAVNEAMHMGVPAIVSDLVGCQQDLVSPGETGWVFPAGQTAALTQGLATAFEAVSSPTRRSQFRVAVQNRISQYTYDATTRGLLDALAAIGASTA